jgi:hypothetical protein
MAFANIRYQNITASTLIAPGPGNFWGFMVNSHTGGTLKVWDSLTASGSVIYNTITFAAGSGISYMFPEGVNFSTGLFATIGGTADITILYGGIDK